MKRREFLKIGACGLAAIAVGSTKIPPIFRSEAHAAYQNLSLSMEAAMVEMIDLTPVFHWVFSSPLTGPSFPGPVICTTTGSVCTLRITNNLPQVHAFQIVGTNIGIPVINPGQTKVLSFTAPSAGTYLYIDPLNAPVNRVLGLHGAFIVLPRPLRVGNQTPYTNPTANVRRLFNDLGATLHFPGDPWLPPPANRSRIWLFTQVDPAFNARAQFSQPINPVEMVQNFLPRYFFVSGKSGAFASMDEKIAPVGNIGEPHLVRILNAGLQTHSPHIHGNHVYVTAVNQVVQSNVFNIDTFTVAPLDTVDWLVPFIRPPDIAGPTNVPLRTLIPQELAKVLITPQSPLQYPMHGHGEIDQTAAGGNYPQGLISHLFFIGDVDKVPFPIPAVR